MEMIITAIRCKECDKKTNDWVQITVSKNDGIRHAYALCRSCNKKLWNDMDRYHNVEIMYYNDDVACATHTIKMCKKCIKKMEKKL